MPEIAPFIVPTWPTLAYMISAITVTRSEKNGTRVNPRRTRWDPGETRCDPGRTRWEPGGTGGPGGTHEDVDGLRWENIGAGCTSPGPVYSVSCLVILLVINVEGKARCRCQSNLAVGKGVAHFRGQEVVWTQIPSTVLSAGQMTKCENCDNVHWQPQQSSVQVCEPKTGLKN